MSLVSAELAATCSALGYYDENTDKYNADENTLETVKDLIRFLKRDDENHDIRRQLGETKVLQTDLLPLLKSYWEETDLFDVLLRLLVNLTTPPLILWNEEIPTDKTVRNYFMQIEEHLQSYKSSFTDHNLWSVLSSRLSKILEKDYIERDDDSSLVIERILILIRNILYVPADQTIERRPDNDANVHDQVSWAMHQSGLLDIILYMTSSTSEQTYHMYILEILSHLFREQNATELGKTELQRNHAEKLKDESELLAIRHRETIKKQQKVKLYSGSRHSRFGGTFVVKTMKSISDNDLIYHKPLSRLENISFDADKIKPKTPRNRLAVHMETPERRSAFSIRLFLKEFCVEFLTGSYNTLMHHVKDQLVRAKSQSNDASYYLWAIRFFMEFNRAYKFEVKLISETLSIQSFHYVQQHMEKYFDMMQTDKKKVRAWSRRLHIALLAYRELLLTLCLMDKSPDGTIRDSSKVIKSNIYYVLEYRELVLTLLVTFDELKMSDQYLKDLIETQHIFLRSFETFCKDGSVIVQQKSKAKRKKKVNVPVEVPQFNPDHEWDIASQQVSSVLETNANIPTDICPFDAASEISIDEQKSETMLSIQRKLRRGEYEYAIGLLRAAREVWPENDSFGSNNMSPEEEFAALREIFMADLGENDPPVQQQPIYDDNDEEEEDEDEDTPNYAEGDLKFEDFVKRLAHPKIIRAVSLALEKFEENTVYSNHCIVKLMHRIAFDCKMYVMFFQVSLFITFKRIYALKELPAYKELVRFANYIIREFVEVTKNNKKIYMEALFWKSCREAYDVEYGYGSYTEKSNAAARTWTEEEEDEVRRLFMEHKEKELDEDVVDWVLTNLIDNTRSRRGLLKKMKEMYLLTDYKKNVRKTNRTKQQWTSEEEEQLADLYEEFKEAMDPLGCIIDRLNVPRPKNRIIEKMLVMGLIQDRKEVRKKRVKGAGGSRSGRPRRNSQSSGSSGDSDDDIPSRAGLSSGNSKRNASISSKKKRVGKNRAIVAVSTAKLAAMTLSIKLSGMDEALEWLKDSFSDVIEDYDEDNDEGIPLVPIMDYAATAMENEDFQNLLTGLGFAKPFDEQETYWRIPCDMSLDTMRSHVELITKALEGTLEIPPEEEPASNTLSSSNSAPLDGGNDDSSDGDVFEQLRGLRQNLNEEEERGPLEIAETGPSETAQASRDVLPHRENNDSSDEDVFERLRKLKQNLNEDDDEPSINQENAGKSNKNPKERKRHVISDDEKENEDVNTTKRRPKRRVFIDESSNDSGGLPPDNASDNDIEVNDESEQQTTTKTKRRRIASSDDNSDPESIVPKQKKRKRTKKSEKTSTSNKTKSKKIQEKKENKTKPKAQKDSSKQAAKVSTSTKQFISKEFISTEDESSDDEEATKKLQQHYENLLKKDVEGTVPKDTSSVSKPIQSSDSEEENDNTVEGNPNEKSHRSSEESE